MDKNEKNRNTFHYSDLRKVYVKLGAKPSSTGRPQYNTPLVVIMRSAQLR